ncbi:MAG: hypothetical protein RL427_1606 [Bacteroidota bacterium]|jgi:hypothetical protein
MKKTHYLALLLLALLVSNCDTNDDGFYLNKFMDANGLVTIAPHASTYAINEKLYIKVNIPRLLPEPGQSNLLDIVTTTGADQFTFSYVIEKQNGTNWDVVAVEDSSLDIVKGAAINGAFVYGGCNYDSTSQTYEYEVGFPLLNSGTGNYRLSFGYNSDATGSVELRSQSTVAHVILNLNSTITGLDGNGYYNFTVE